MSLNKVYESKHIQIYKENGKFKECERYEYIYKYLTTNDSFAKNIQVYKSCQFPYNLLSISTGFLFVHDVGKQSAEIPALPDDEYEDYKTNLKCLSNGFIDQKDINTVMNVRPSMNCHPNCINDYTITLNIKLDDSKIDKTKIFNRFAEIQEKFKNVKDWKKYIYNNCPSHIHFAKTITNETFKKKISLSDMSIDYDIHDVNEIEIIKIIEHTFEDMNQTVRILDNYNHIFDRIKKECDKNNIKYSSSEEIKHKRLKYKGEPKNLRYKGIKWIELKYSDLMKLNITYKLTDFIS